MQKVDNPRNEMLGFKMTKNEKQAIQDRADKLGKPVSTYVRETLLADLNKEGSHDVAKQLAKFEKQFIRLKEMI